MFPRFSDCLPAGPDCQWQRKRTGGLQPAVFDLTLAEAQGTHAYRLFNLNKDPKQVRVSVVSWDFDDRGEIRILPSSDTSLDQWVVVNPIEFTIPPGESQAVRFSIRPALQLADGEHRAMLIFDEVLQPQPVGEASGTGAQTALRARFQFRTAIYCQTGAVSRRAELVSAQANASMLSLQTRATGSANTRFEGQFMVWKASGFPGLDKVFLLGNLAGPKPELPHGMVAAGQLPGSRCCPAVTDVRGCPWQYPAQGTLYRRIARSPWRRRAESPDSVRRRCALSTTGHHHDWAATFR